LELRALAFNYNQNLGPVDDGEQWQLNIQQQPLVSRQKYS